MSDPSGLGLAHSSKMPSFLTVLALCFPKATFGQVMLTLQWMQAAGGGLCLVYLGKLPKLK